MYINLYFVEEIRVFDKVHFIFIDSIFVSHDYFLMYRKKNLYQ